MQFPDLLAQNNPWHVDMPLKSINESINHSLIIIVQELKPLSRGFLVHVILLKN